MIFDKTLVAKNLPIVFHSFITGYWLQVENEHILDEVFTKEK